MVTRDGRVKVMDFGIARLVAGPDTVEQTAAVLGTAAYLSPEQAQGQSVDARSDLYSLGRRALRDAGRQAAVHGRLGDGRRVQARAGDAAAAVVAEPRRAAEPGRRGDARPGEEPREPLPERGRVPRRSAPRHRGPGRGGHAAAAGGRRRHAGDLASAAHRGAAPDRARRGQPEGLDGHPDRRADPADPGRRRLSAGPEPPRRRPEAAGSRAERGRRVARGRQRGARSPRSSRWSPSSRCRTSGPGRSSSRARRAGDEAEEGSEVTLTIAKAPKTFEVPNLAGSTIDEATALLAEQGLELGEQTEQESDSDPRRHHHPGSAARR